LLSVLCPRNYRTFFLTIVPLKRSMVSMKERYLTHYINTLCFSDHKIAFVSGPRQCGKTTLAKMMLAERGAGTYRNWDQIEFRREWTKSPSSIVPETDGQKIPIIVLDEIHKERRWKRNLKGIYDTLQSPCDIMVTGSARLSVYMKGSDSLLGRYFSFRLHPFSMRELEKTVMPRPEEVMETLFSITPEHDMRRRTHLGDLLKYGPFPEPLIGQDERKTRMWRRNREQLVIREDLRDLSRLPDLSRIEMLAAIIPERVGNPFSKASVREDLECRFDSLKRWLEWLKELYYLFEIKPYSKNIPRALKREGKVYLWDYGAIQDEGAKFENLVACHLLKACHFWTDTGEGDFELWYLRNKEKQEIDFLITRNNEPWLPVEVKLTDTIPSSNWKKFMDYLPCRRALQLVNTPVWQNHRHGDSEILVADAAEALPLFV